MKKVSFTFFGCFLFLVQLHAKPTESLKADLLKHINQSKIKKEDLSLYITTMEGDHPQAVIDINSHKKMIPASISKVVTTSAVLSAFKPGFKFKTQLWLPKGSKDAKSILNGNLYLKGGGDPSFVSENMWFLVNSFKRTGIQKIEGDLIVDDSLFDQVRYDESRQDQRVDRAYDAPVGAMSFNWNSINIFVRPGTAGEKAQVFLDPENGYTELVNKTKTKSGNGSDLSADRNGRQVIVSGTIGDRANEVVIFKNIQEPDLWAGENLKSFLLQRGILVTGKVKNGKVPETAELAAESESRSIEQIVSDMNKFSNNYVAEMLCKNIAVAKEQLGTLKSCISLIKDHAKQIGVEADEFEFYNPSGLTRDNKMSAHVLWKFLDHLQKDFRLYPEVVISLPISGVDGTLKKRMKDSPAEGWVRAKTGYLNGVVSLAGYAGRPDGRVFTFSFIYNGGVDEARIRNFFDQMLILLVK